MWSDHEAELDLLGFSDLVDSLELLVLNASLRPITIGLTGDWGSGKSTVQRIAKLRLEELASGEDGPAIRTVSFSPWMHDGYEDVKLALIDAILREVIGDETVTEEQRRGLQAIRDWIRSVASDRGSVKSLMMALFAIAGATTDIGALDAAGVVGGSLIDVLPEPASEAEDDDADPPSTVFELRTALTSELTEAGGVTVVFVDDVDRCLPKEVVSTFEVMRLFSDIPNVVFIVAANKKMVAGAITARYEGLGYRNEDALGQHYLEKMWQMEIEVPALSASEVRAYLALLCCSLYAPERFQAAVDAVDELRDEGRLSALSDAELVGIVSDDLEENDREDFERHLEWSRKLSDVLATNKNFLGNPRQVKRFANRLILAAEGMRRRNEDVDVRVLAKFLFLADTAIDDYSKLAKLVVAYPDDIQRWLQALEEPAVAAEDDDAEGNDESVDLPDELREWAEKPSVAGWLVIEPPVAGSDLNGYMRGVRRDPALTDGGRLSKDEQRLVEALTANATGARDNAINEVADLQNADQQRIVAVLLRLIADQPRSKALDSIIKLRGDDPKVLEQVAGALRSIPVGEVPISHPDRLLLLIDKPVNDAIAGVIDEWASDGPEPLRKRAENAKAKISDSTQ